VKDWRQAWAHVDIEVTVCVSVGEMPTLVGYGMSKHAATVLAYAGWPAIVALVERLQEEAGDE
jgi:hypothetical protein